MIFPVAVGFLLLVLLVVFFYRSTSMDLSGAIVAALVSAAILSLLVAAAIFAGQIFG